MRVEDGTRLPPADVRAVTALLADATREDGVTPVSEHVALDLREAVSPTSRHLLLREATGPDAGLVGYAHVDRAPLGGAVAEFVVHPARRRRGHGRSLARAVQEAGPQGRVHVWAHGEHPGAMALAASLGWRVVRRLWCMERSLAAPPPPVDVPDHVRVRTFRQGDDDQAWLRLNARAFRDHPEQGGWTLADLRARLGEPWFHPEGFLLAEEAPRPDPRAPEGASADPDGPPAAPEGTSAAPEGTSATPDGPAPGSPRLLAFCWTKVHPPETGSAPHGELYVIGVDPDAQGMRLGRAMTLWGLHRLRDQGLDTAILYVDASNAPAATLYRNLGFTVRGTDVQFATP